MQTPSPHLPLHYSHLYPLALLARGRHRCDGPLDPEARIEVDHPRRLTGDAVEQLVALDDLEVVEAQTMARRGNEAIIRRVRRGRENGAEAARLLRAIRRIELQLVEALLVEHKR